MNFNNILFLIKQFLKTAIFILLLISCELEKEIDFPVDFTDEGTICVIGLVSGEGTAEVYIAAVQHPYKRSDTIQATIDSVFLYGDNDVEVQLFKDTSDLWVQKNIDVSIGNSYWVSVWSNGSNIYSDADEMPGKTEIDSVNLVAQGGEIYGKFYFRTVPDMFYSYRVDDSTKYSTYDDNYKMGASILDEIEYQSEMSIVFSRTNFNDPGAEIKIILNSLSEAYYQYALSLEEYSYTRDDMYYEPTLVYNNINNGRGFFGCFQADTLKIKYHEILE